MAEPEDLLAHAIKLLGSAGNDLDYRNVVERAYYSAYHAASAFEESLPYRSKAQAQTGSHDALLQRLERPDAQLDAVAGLLGVVANARAADHDISRTYLVARDDLFKLAAWWLRRDNSDAPKVPILADWRRELLGQELLDLLAGKLSLVFDKTPNAAAIRVKGES